MVEPILSISNLTLRFKNNTIHDRLNLDVFPNQVLVLLGASGSGKSSLLRTLIGLEKPAEGHCIFENENLYSLRENEWINVRKKIAYAFQNGALFDSLTVTENLLYPLKEHTRLSKEEALKKIDNVLSEFGLKEAGHLLPASLSGGMQKRVGLARAIMLEPVIILYDEPTAGLDPANTHKINDAILSLKNTGKTSVLVTHDTQSALAVGDRFAFIKDKKISAIQTKTEFLKTPNKLLKSYFEGGE